MTEQIKTILYVDEGDTASSKMAVAIARHIAERDGLDVSFGSAGVFACAGMAVDKNAVRALRETYDISLSEDEVSRELTPEVFGQYDRVTSMLYRLNIYVNEKAHRWPNGGNFSIVKPAGKGYEEYVLCAKALWRNIEAQLSGLVQAGNVQSKAV